MVQGGRGAGRKVRTLVGLLLLAALLAACTTPDGGRRREALWAMDFARAGGGRVQLAEYRGRVVLLDVFATWSQPSMVAIPRYGVLLQRYESRGLSVVGIALDELGDRVVGPFLAGMGVAYPVALADEDLRQGESPLGDIEAIPTLLVFDRQGGLVQVFYGLVPSEAIEALVRQLL